jgi:hypothetical protein
MADNTTVNFAAAVAGAPDIRATSCPPGVFRPTAAVAASFPGCNQTLGRLPFQPLATERSPASYYVKVEKTRKALLWPRRWTHVVLIQWPWVCGWLHLSGLRKEVSHHDL